MASLPLRPCPGCRRVLVRSGRCPACRVRHAQELVERRRRQAEARPWDSLLGEREWRELSARVRREEPICRLCGVRPSEVADHIIRRRDRPDLAMERSNLRGVCRRCHAREWGSK
jgi:5-methylcytosine-specific restriction endonuclease McrA